MIRRFCLIIFSCATTAVILSAPTFAKLHSFNATDGMLPTAALIQGIDGNLYGPTTGGGANAAGTVFKITPTGKLTTVYNFCSQRGTYCTDGQYPATALIQSVNGDFYGTTYPGGANNGGVIFHLTASGALTTLYSFCAQAGCADGTEPASSLTQATNGDFYGATFAGGAHGAGTIFKLTSSGAFSTLYSFCAKSACADGSQPGAGLVQGGNGDFYGTTSAGGANRNNGTAFVITPSGALTTLYSFCAQSVCTDGAAPLAGLIQANGNLYGTTFAGGAHGYGTVFQLSPAGALTTLYSFCASTKCADGENPAAALVQATDGNLYGTTQFGGGSASAGTLFKITPTGALTTLYTFCATSGCPDGDTPSGLVQFTNGAFYGTTQVGGGSTACKMGCGTVFAFSAGLSPFVKAQPPSGKAGALIEILGSKLTGATSVTFNGVAATFAVLSSSLITATVPAGATTGAIQVVTPAGALLSNAAFRVLP